MELHRIDLALFKEELNKLNENMKIIEQYYNKVITDLADAKTVLQKSLDNVKHKTDFFDVELSTNLFDKTKITVGKAIDNGSGTIVDSTNYNISDFIPIKPSTAYRTVYGNNLAYYDSAMQYISGSGINSTTSISPSNGAYIRISIRNDYVDSEMLVEGNTLPSIYIPYKKYYTLSSDVKVKEDNLPEKVVSVINSFTDKRGLNLFNKDTAVADKYINTSGNVTSGTGYYASDWIEVTPELTYTSNVGSIRAIYDANKAFISSINSTVQTIPSNGAYVRVSIPSSRINDFMLVEGTTLPLNYTSYEEWKENKDLKIDYSQIKNAPNSGINQWYNKKWVAIGDSITTYRYADENGITLNWAEDTAERLGVASLKRCAQPGKKMHEIAEIMSTSNTTEQMLIDANLITVSLGQNNWSDPLGTINDIAVLNATSFYGATKGLIKYLLGLNSTCTLVFITPTPSANREAALRARSKVIIEVCELYSIPVLDLNKISNFNSTNYAHFYIDGTVHPNGMGYRRMGLITAEFLKGSMSSTGDKRDTGTVNLDSPVFTGTPTAPTAEESTNTKQIATTEFVKREVVKINNRSSYITDMGIDVNTDITARLQELITDILPQGTTVKIPKGEFLLNGNINIKKEINFIGEKEAVIKSNSTIRRRIIADSRILFEGISFDRCNIRFPYNHESQSIIKNCKFLNVTEEGAIFGDTGFNRTPKNIAIIDNTFINCMYGVKGGFSNSIINSNIFNNGDNRRNIEINMGMLNTIAFNRIGKGITGIAFLCDASLTKRIPVMGNKVIGNTVSNISEEGISFDVYGNDTAKCSSLLYDTIVTSVNSSGNFCITTTKGIPSANAYLESFVVFLNGNLKGQVAKIKSMGSTGLEYLELDNGNNVFTTQISNVVGSKIVIIIPFMFNDIMYNNIQSATLAGIHLYGNNIGQRVMYNNLHSSKLRMTSLGGLITDRKAVNMFNKIRYNDIYNSELVLDGKAWTGDIAPQGYMNDISGNNLFNSILRIPTGAESDLIKNNNNLFASIESNIALA